jgi:integrase
MSTTRYQQGSVERVKRAKGPDVWVYRYRQTIDGKRLHRSRVLGTVKELKSKAEAKRTAENLRAEVNAAEDRAAKMTVTDAWGHFQAYELRDPDVNRSPTTITSYLDYFKSRILPQWGATLLDDVKAVAVERWLRSLDLASASKAKIRSHMSSLFSHCIRHELYDKPNPVSSVRQSAKRLHDPDILTVEELKAIIAGIVSQAIRVMVLVAGSSALRRSELRGLKWSDLDFDELWFNLKRGVMRKHLTEMKTKASKKSVPMLPELGEVLRQWRTETPHPMDDDWVFASPYTNGERLYWAESAVVDHVRPAAAKAGIKKHITCHVFRHSLGTIMKTNKEDVKTIHEILRHANSRITLDVYTQGDMTAKRAALLQVVGHLRRAEDGLNLIHQ